jgi:ADP-ribose pyrophosphatase
VVVKRSCSVHKRDERALTAWTVLGSEESLGTPWFRIQKYSCQLPDGKIVRYYVQEASDSAMCVCVTAEGLVVIERQYRFPLRAVSMDYPAGFVKSGEDPQAAALRELQEETGFVSPNVIHLITLAKDPSFAAGKMHVFLATDAYQALDRGGESKIVVDLLRPTDILEAVRTSAISCAFCVAATLRAAQVLGWKV